MTAYDHAGLYGIRSGSYYHTTRLSPEQAQEAVREAKRQDDAILAIYRSRGPLSPSDVLRICEANGKRWPLTSVRRAITTLTDDGALVRMEQQKPGLYRKPEHLWALAQPEQVAA